MPKTGVDSALPKSPKAPFLSQPEDIHISKLLLDPNNYRFLDRRKFKKKAATRFHEDTVQKATLDSLEQSYQLDELKHSILTNGYVPMERIIVVPYAAKPGRYLVVEGNRRVGALRSLLREDEEGVSKLSADQKKSFSTIPCVVLKSSGDSLKHAERVIMGIRHIAGPKEWGAYQQALLVSELKDGENLEFKEIGEMLGISSVETARRYRAIGALKSMEEDELFGKKAEPSFYRLFHELVSLPEVRARFGWSSDKSAFTNADEARQFFELISSNGKEDAKIQTYGDVRKLRSVVGNSKAEECLFDPEQPLSEAFRIGEQGKKSVDPIALLKEAKASLSEIGFIQASKLGTTAVETIDELIDILQSLRTFAISKKGK